MRRTPHDTVYCRKALDLGIGQRGLKYWTSEFAIVHKFE